jgi:hypothetical protein
MTQVTKGKAKKVVKSKSSSSSSSSSSPSSSSSAISQAICSPPTLNNNGAKKTQHYILSPDEQNAFRRHSNEIKQVSALIVLKVGLGVQEHKIISQKMQEDHFIKDFVVVYDKLSTDAIVGSRVKNIPMKFLNIGTSKAKEIMELSYGKDIVR